MNKLIFILSILLFVFQAKADILLSKNDSVSFIDAIKEIERNHKVKFAFDHQILSSIKVKKLDYSLSIDEILSQVIDSNYFNFEFSEHTILIIPIRQKTHKNIALSGIVLDEDTGEALPNALVYLRESEKYTITNRDGRFNFLNIPSDTSILEISYIGYLTQRFKPNQFMSFRDATFNLSNSTKLLDDVVVSEFHQKAFDISSIPSKLSVNMDDFKSLSSFGEPDVFRALQLLPGISATNETSAGLSIRGGKPEQNLVLFDGFTIYHLDHFFGMFSAINSNVIKDVQVYKGGFGAEYGTRISGVMDITGKTGNTTKTSGNLALNFISANGILEVPIGKKVSALVAVRRSYTDVIQSALYKKLFNHVKENNPNAVSGEVDDAIEFIDPDFYFYDLNTKITYNINDKNLLSYSFYDGNDNLFINDSDGFDDDLGFYNYTSSEVNKWGNQGATIRYARQWNDNFFTDVIVSGSTFFRDHNYNFDYEYNYKDISDILLLDSLGNDFFTTDTLLIDEASNYSYLTKNEVFESAIKINSEYKINDSNILNFGLYSINNETIDYKTYDDIYSDDKKLDSNLIGIFSQYNYSPNSKTSIISGFRLSKYSITDKSYFEPRFSFNHKISESINLKGSMGRYYQFLVNINVNDPSSTRSPYWWLASEEVPILKSNHFVAGFTIQKNNTVIDIEGYYKGVSGLSEIYANQYEDGVESFENLFVGDGKYYGVEMMVKKKIGKLETWVSYTLSKSENKFEGINFSKYYPTNQDQRHEFKWVNIYNINKWTISSTWIFGTGKFYTPPKSTIDLENFEFYQEINFNTRNSKRLPNYHRLDLNFGYNTKLSNKVNLEFGINLLNLYNRNNIKGYRTSPFITNDISSDIISQTKAVKLLNFTPSLFLNLSF